MTLIDKAEALRIVMEECYKDREMKLATRIEERIAAIPARGVGVKPLVWTAREDGLQFYAKQHASGSIYFYYTVLFSEHTSEWSVLLDGLWRDGFPDAETAKAAAQADYEARILAALAPTDAAHVNETPKSEHDGADVLTAAQAREAAHDADLLFDAYKGLLVLHRMLDKSRLDMGAKTAAEIIARIEAAHPEMPGRSALRATIGEART